MIILNKIKIDLYFYILQIILKKYHNDIILMGKKSGIENITSNIKKIISNNSPEKAIIKISNIKNPKNNDKMGIDRAYKIYELYIDYSEVYDKNVYGNNVSLWNKKIGINLKLAKEAYKRIKNND